MPESVSDLQIIAHLLHGMEYTGRPYRGSRETYIAMLDRYIQRHGVHHKRKPKHEGNTVYRKFTKAEDKEIMKSDNLTETARKLGRKQGSVWARQQILKERKKDE